MGSLDGDTTDTIHVANNLSNAVYCFQYLPKKTFKLNQSIKPIGLKKKNLLAQRQKKDK